MSGRRDATAVLPDLTGRLLVGDLGEPFAVMIAKKMLRDMCTQKTVSEVEFGFVPHIQSDHVRHQVRDFNRI